MTDRALAELHLRTLYVHDSSGRITAETVDEGRLAPRFVLVRTTEGNLWRLREDVRDDIATRLSLWADSEPSLATSDRHQRVDDYANLLGGQVRSGMAYAFPDEDEPPSRVREIGPAEADILRPTFPELAIELAHGQGVPCMAVMVDGVAASVCCSARFVEGAAQAGLSTAVSHRGQGLAVQVALAWGRAVRAMGAEPIYSTTADNRASQGVARKAGLRLFALDLTVD